MRPALAADPAVDSPSCPDPTQACVVVEQVGASGPPTVVAAFTSDRVTATPDVQNQTYDGDVSVASGTSVATLLEEAGVAQGTVQFVEVDGPDDYGRHLLTPAEWQGSSKPPPAFYPDPSAPGRMNFVRDPRAGTDDDDPSQPGPDQGRLLSDDDGALVLVVHTSGSAGTTATATATPTDSSDRTFTMTCSGCADLDTTWYFPDGTTSTQASPTYTFPDDQPAGSYLVALAVEDPTDGSFGWAQTDARIGPAPTPSASATSPATGGNGHGQHGATHGGSSQGGSAAGHGGSGDGSPRTPTTTPSASAITRPTAPAAPSSLPGLSSGLSSGLPVPDYGGPLLAPPPRPQRSRSTPTPTATPTVVATPSGPTVSGVLLDSAQLAPVAPAAGAVTDAPDPSAAAPATDSPFRVDPLVWLGIGGVLLVAVGALSEDDRVRRAVVGRLPRWARIEA